MTASSVRPGAIEVLATPAQSAGTLFGGAVRPVGLNDDLTFELKVWPGKARLLLTNIPPGWTMRSVRYRHVDVTENGIEFKPGEPIGLPPGEYSLIALDRLDDADSRDPEFLDRVRTAASSFTLTEAETKTFDLRLNAESGR